MMVITWLALAFEDPKVHTGLGLLTKCTASVTVPVVAQLRSFGSCSVLALKLELLTFTFAESFNLT
jgi:hypothetical protein